MLRTSSCHGSFVLLCLELNVRPQKTVKTALLWSFVVCNSKLGEGRGGFPSPPTTAPPLPYSSLWSQRDALNGPHTTASSVIDHKRLTPFMQWASMHGSQANQHAKFHLLNNPCVFKMNTLLWVLQRGMTLESTGIIITSESSAPARVESLFLLLQAVN